MGAEPNSQVELVDCGMPGALPVINEYCVDQAILTGLSINAKINQKSIFDRKKLFLSRSTPRLPNFSIRISNCRKRFSNYRDKVMVKKNWYYEASSRTRCRKEHSR